MSSNHTDKYGGLSNIYPSKYERELEKEIAFLRKADEFMKLYFPMTYKTQILKESINQDGTI